MILYPPAQPSDESGAAALHETLGVLRNKASTLVDAGSTLDCNLRGYVDWGIGSFVITSNSWRSPLHHRKELLMIVRMWHGRVPTSKARTYREFTNARAIPDYQSTPGNISVYVLERADGNVTHFITLTFWESVESIRKFAGEDIEKAKYYPEDKDFLLEFEPKVVHYEVVGQSAQ